MRALQILLISTCVALIESNSTAAVDNRTGRVSNGEDYVPELFPYLVLIYMYTDPVTGSCTTCSGSLVTPRHVVTAAHCTDPFPDSSGYKIRFNGEKGETLGVEKIFQNERYIPFKGADLSVLQLNGTFRSATKYARLYGDKSDIGEQGMKCTIVGFGRDENNVKHNDGKMAEITLLSGRECARYDNLIKWDQFLCVQPGRKVSCTGDSGGPVICDGVQYGVSSDGHDISGERNKVPACGSPNSLSTYQYLKMYEEWMENIIKDDREVYESDAGITISLHQKLYTVLVVYIIINYL